jgi:hypothetical protein
MLFLAHCSFHEKGDEPYHGYFTYLVKAPDPEAARERLREMILAVRESDDLFDGDVEIYLDDLIAARRLPRRGVIGRVQSFRGDRPNSVYASLPFGARGVWVADRKGLPDDADDEGEKDAGGDDQGVTLEPFMVFRARAGR